jgi:Holliday junction resolvasome RuvABC DNA-binding subunit
MNMIAVQDAYVARVGQAWAKQGPRSAGLMFARSKRAARKDAMAALIKLGYSGASAAQIVQDAQDMFALEAACGHYGK